jgi:hypothetical protein
MLSNVQPRSMSLHDCVYMYTVDQYKELPTRVRFSDLAKDILNYSGGPSYNLDCTQNYYLNFSDLSRYGSCTHSEMCKII